jgi:hypothetical protein
MERNIKIGGIFHFFVWPLSVKFRNTKYYHYIPQDADWELEDFLHINQQLRSIAKTLLGKGYKVRVFKKKVGPAILGLLGEDARTRYAIYTYPKASRLLDDPTTGTVKDAEPVHVEKGV